MRKAVAKLVGENNVSGVVTFEQSEPMAGTKVTASFEGLPQGKHGFHIHEFGDTTNGCTSTGAHYNPFGHDHGGPQSSERHIGDMGNVESSGEDPTIFEITDDSITLCGPYSVLGRAVVVHADQDDLGQGGWEDSKITGHAGARLACGVIGWAT